MDFECKDIPLSQIDSTDRTFEISTDDSLEILKASIRSLGVIHPPILIEKPRMAGKEVSYIPIAGFRRIEACRELRFRFLTANCLGSETPFYQCALVAITESHFQKALNPIEISRCFALIEKSGEQGDKVLKSLHSIGFQANDASISKFKRLNRMDRLIKNGVIEGAIALPVALDLFDMSDQDGAMALAQLFVELRISLSRQRELMDWIQAIAHRERTEIKAVLADEAIRNWLVDETLDPPDKANLIRDHFRKDQKRNFWELIHRKLNGQNITAYRTRPGYSPGTLTSLKKLLFGF